MKILAIESSCDETAAAIVEDGTHLLSNVVHSQIDIHAEFGGVIPEIAARSHLEVVNPVVLKALHDAKLKWDDIDAIAVTYAPGLVGSLLIGTLTARMLAKLHSKPLYAIHHVEAHVYANFITKQSDQLSLVLPFKQPIFPMLPLIVSGKHSELVLFRGHGDYKLLGETQDDAVGEAFDKVAKIIGLPYPGGPSIEKITHLGDPHKYAFPKAKLASPYDFSFSGLKTTVLRTVQRETGVDFRFPSHQLAERLTEAQRNDFAASFSYSAVKTLVDNTERAYIDFAPASVVIAGGVAASSELRRQLSERLPLPIEYAPMSLCTDNAAMVGALAYFYSKIVDPTPVDELKVQPSLSMTSSIWNDTDNS